MFGWHQQFNGHEFEQTLGDSEGQGKPGVLQSMGSQRVRHDRVTELNCTDMKLLIFNPFKKKFQFHVVSSNIKLLSV